MSHQDNTRILYTYIALSHLVQLNCTRQYTYIVYIVYVYCHVTSCTVRGTVAYIVPRCIHYTIYALSPLNVWIVRNVEDKTWSVNLSLSLSLSQPRCCRRASRKEECRWCSGRSGCPWPTRLTAGLPICMYTPIYYIIIYMCVCTPIHYIIIHVFVYSSILYHIPIYFCVCVYVYKYIYVQTYILCIQIYICTNIYPQQPWDAVQHIL